MKYLEVQAGAQIELREHTRQGEAHVFTEDSILAINGALAAERPLLVRGEPGVGKSQLAVAAAQALGRPFVSRVVDARTEARDLLYELDAVERLARAQVVGSLGGTTQEKVSELLDEKNFVTPGPLWWVFDFDDAAIQAKRVGAREPERPKGWTPADGAVLLIDEIDKADTSVPNGLLDALGNGEMMGPGRTGVIRRVGAPPLVIITTNEERSLPDAFLRRCLVLHLALPTSSEELRSFLVARGRAHFPECSDEILEEAAVLLVEDRVIWLERGLAPPGQAEYLDLLRALQRLSKKGEDPLPLLRAISTFTFKKHPPADIAP